MNKPIIIHIGILPLKEFKSRSLKMANGTYEPQENEPKLWFNSIESFIRELERHGLNIMNAYDNNSEGHQCD